MEREQEEHLRVVQMEREQEEHLRVVQMEREQEEHLRVVQMEREQEHLRVVQMEREQEEHLRVVQMEREQEEHLRVVQMEREQEEHLRVVQREREQEEHLRVVQMEREQEEHLRVVQMEREQEEHLRVGQMEREQEEHLRVVQMEREQEEHLRVVHMERCLYKTIVKAAKDTAANLGLQQLSANNPGSRSMVMHYSFDYAQQVHLPSSPMQPGPLYFLVPRKWGLFGVCCEAISKQINFLIDEAHLVSKGSNAVISFLDFFFTRYGLGETNTSLHCDNCAGQNENRFVLWYCAWRMLTGQHRSISLHFIVAGPTKFAPDCCFGLLKQASRRHEVSSLTDLETVVNSSAGVNQAQLVGREGGEKLVTVHDWQAHLG